MSRDIYMRCVAFLCLVSSTSSVLVSRPRKQKKCLDANKWWEEQLDSNFGLGKNSQYDQDAKLMSLFRKDHLGTTNKFYVEFGFTGLDNAQTERLKNEMNFTGFRMDKSCEALPKVHNCSTEWIEPKTIVSLFQKYGSPKQPDYVSIDIDSTDIWVFGNLTKTFRPRVFTVEYASNHPLEEIYESPHMSSLSAINRAATKSGYSLVGVEPSLDAFLVRSDLVCVGTELKLSAFAKFTGLETPHSGMPRDRRRRGCPQIGLCEINWTLRAFPCNTSTDEFCTGYRKAHGLPY